jgi:hypothetical protein
VTGLAADAALRERLRGVYWIGGGSGAGKSTSLLKIAGRTSDPDRALRNLLERDRMFTGRLRDEAGQLGLPGIEVDAAMTEDGLVKRVAEGFGLTGR